MIESSTNEECEQEMANDENESVVRMTRDVVRMRVRMRAIFGVLSGCWMGSWHLQSADSSR